MQLDKKSLQASTLVQLAASGQLQNDAVKASATKMCDQFAKNKNLFVEAALVCRPYFYTRVAV